MSKLQLSDYCLICLLVIAFALFSFTVNAKIFNDIGMKAAWYPNTGYVLINTLNSANSFTCDEQKGLINHTVAKWTGITVSHAMLKLDVASSNSKTLTLSDAPNESLNVNSGFIVANELELLDSTGDWYLEDTPRTVFLCKPIDDTLAYYKVGSSTVENGITNLIIANHFDSEYQFFAE